ncbi:hypothetical protein NEFER03_2060 [Nematocida sp. LUAm3]|nr:hypothetical protein NEFER03_2060 [Nematocida sp. LUAm3]KAI5176222.1 hypothetical protein NEFER02_2028 [Nematocida sp. LUAm2]KAI5179210.1 hypothetical protein NEFER01_2067 [Nematocida sp. LUAm1]
MVLLIDKYNLKKSFQHFFKILSITLVAVFYSSVLGAHNALDSNGLTESEATSIVKKTFFIEKKTDNERVSWLNYEIEDVEGFVNLMEEEQEFHSFEDIELAKEKDGRYQVFALYHDLQMKRVGWILNESHILTHLSSFSLIKCQSLCIEASILDISKILNLLAIVVCPKLNIRITDSHQFAFNPDSVRLTQIPQSQPGPRKIILQVYSYLLTKHILSIVAVHGVSLLKLKDLVEYNLSILSCIPPQTFPYTLELYKVCSTNGQLAFPTNLHVECSSLTISKISESIMNMHSLCKFIQANPISSLSIPHAALIKVGVCISQSSSKYRLDFNSLIVTNAFFSFVNGEAHLEKYAQVEIRAKTMNVYFQRDIAFPISTSEDRSSLVKRILPEFSVFCPSIQIHLYKNTKLNYRQVPH